MYKSGMIFGSYLQRIRQLIQRKVTIPQRYGYCYTILNYENLYVMGLLYTVKLVKSKNSKCVVLVAQLAAYKFIS